MAKRMKSKIQPAVMKLNFVVLTDKNGAKVPQHVDLSQVASIVNRRFYRQGLNWAVAGFKFLSSNQGQVSVHKLPNTWVMSNAWEKSFRAWQQMIKNATDESGSQSIKGKFLDFKVYANSDHHDAGVGANLLPHSAETKSSGIQTATAGQWDMSTIEVPSVPPASTGVSTEWDLIAVGPNNPGVSLGTGNDAKSLIVGYANSRALPDIADPNTPADASDLGDNWIMSLFTEGTQQDASVIETLELTGDQAPYPFENDGTHTDTMYPGGETQLNSLEIHSQEFITSTTVGGTTYMLGGNFPCGLIEITTANFDTEAGILMEITLVPGTHRGYLADPMTEM